MNQIPEPSLLAEFGTSRERVSKALEALRQGRGLLLVDDEDRENEGDLIFSAEHLREEQMALLIREGSGIVCLCLTGAQIDRLDLPMMTTENTSKNQTAFTVSIEAKEGVSTGVSAHDRVRTIRVAIHPEARPQDLARPGHVFPLKARPGGVLARRGHTEGTVDLMLLAGLQPAGVLCELTNPEAPWPACPRWSILPGATTCRWCPLKIWHPGAGRRPQPEPSASEN